MEVDNICICSSCCDVDNSDIFEGKDVEVVLDPGDSLIALLEPILAYAPCCIEVSQKLKTPHRIDRKVQWIISNESVQSPPSGYLVFLDFHSLETSDPSTKSARQRAKKHITVLKVDLLASIIRCNVNYDEGRTCIQSISYKYFRMGTETQFEFFLMDDPQTHTSASTSRTSDLVKIDFILSQYGYFQKMDLTDKVSTEDEFDNNPNVIAKGFEGAGRVTRQALQLSGKISDISNFLRWHIYIFVWLSQDPQQEKSFDSWVASTLLLTSRLRRSTPRRMMTQTLIQKRIRSHQYTRRKCRTSPRRR
jgi:hypothetical protein